MRDLSRKSKKKIELSISGEDTEVDKTIAEELADPLLHMIRNVRDHGVDTPEERAAAGKNPGRNHPAGCLSSGWSDCHSDL